MKMGGVSLTGAYHARNQDNFAVRAVEGGHVLIVSDGLGSRKRSQAGSAAICAAACDIAAVHACVIDEPIEFLERVHAAWLEILKRHHLNVHDCCATALIAVKNDDEIWAFRLGDGFISIATDGKIVSLFDDKEDSFTNYTDCLDVEFRAELWQCERLSAKNFRGIVAATDGLPLEIEDDNLKIFVEGFIEGYIADELGSIIADIKSWLPKYVSADDRTLAFLLKGGD